MIVKSFAKINLILEIGPIRSDRFHQISSVFHSIDLADVLEFNLTDRGVKLNCPSSLEEGENNLVYKAAKKLWELSGKARGVEINLTKNIPIQAGLGGGSSNAAMTLLALNILWNLQYPREVLKNIGRELGSDVEFFFYGGCALMDGRGDIFRKNLNPLPQEIFIALAKPSAGTNTREMYKLYDNLSVKDEFGSATKHFFKLYQYGFHLSQPIFTANYFLDIAIMKIPEIKEIIERFKKFSPLAVNLCGSGSTVFALFCERAIAENALKSLEDIASFIYLGKPIGREEYRKQSGVF